MSSLSPAISLTSTIIGFISFGLTILIWLHSFWNAFQTVAGAHRQIQDELSLLRQRLYEEAEYLRMLRRRERPKSSDRYGRSRDRDRDRDEKGGGGGYHSSGRPKKDAVELQKEKSAKKAGEEKTKKRAATADGEPRRSKRNK